MIKLLFNSWRIVVGFGPSLCVYPLIIIVGLIYSFGLSGPFVFDDAINIVNNQSLRLTDFSWNSLSRAVVSIPNGVFGRPISMLTFAVNFYWDRDAISPFLAPNTFKTTNLLVHLTNGWLVFILSSLIMKAVASKYDHIKTGGNDPWLPLIVSAAWMLSPFNLTGVLYVVQRMTSLATLFMLLGMVFYLMGRSHLGIGKGGAEVKMVAAVAIFTPLAFLCKEIGILLPAYLALIEWLLFGRYSLLKAQRKFVQIYFTVFLGIPMSAAAFIVVERSNWFAVEYTRRDFNFVQRLMTEARAIWFYLCQTLVPNISKMGLFHDDFIISTGPLDPISTIPAILGIFMLIGVIIFIRKYQPLLAFGLAYFLLGHSLESSIIPLEIMHEHRNYMPSIGLFVAAFSLLMGHFLPAKALYMRRFGAALLLILFATVTTARVKEWSSAKNLWEAETMHHPDSVRAHVAMGNYYAATLTFDAAMRESNFIAAKNAYIKALKIDENNVAALFGILKLGKIFERPIDSQYVEKLRVGLMEGPLLANANDQLIELALCIGQPHCAVNADQFEGLLDAALSNWKLRNRDKALLYSAEVFYLTNIAHDYQRALTSVRKAISLDGDIEYQLWLAKIFIEMQDIDSARQQIISLRKLDNRNIRQKEIAEFESRIEGNFKVMGRQ